MWNWYDSSYEDFEDLGGLAHHHHVVHDPMQPPHDYGLDGIGLHSSGRGVSGVGQHYRHVCFPVSYVMVNEDGQEQEPHHSMYPQIMTNHIPHPPIPQLPSLQSAMLSPSLPHSYLMYQPSVMPQMQQVISPSPVPPPPIPLLPLTNRSSTTQQQHDQCTIGCDNNGTKNKDNTMVAAGERITNDSLPLLHQLLSEERTVATGMTSSVIIHDSLLSRPQQSNNDEISQSIQPSTVTQVNATNEVKIQNTIKVDDDKVVTVCKQAILFAINKIIADNYKSALHKIRKIVRVLDILMFNEGGSGIRSAKIETVRPWFETLKGMEERISLKNRQQQKKNNHNPENTVFIKSERSYCRQVRQKSRYNSSSRYAYSGKTTYNYNKNTSSSSSSSSNGQYGNEPRQIWWKSNNRRYRTTGKLIME